MPLEAQDLTMAPLMQTTAERLKTNDLAKNATASSTSDKMTWRWVEHKLRTTGSQGAMDKNVSARSADRVDSTGAR